MSKCVQAVYTDIKMFGTVAVRRARSIILLRAKQIVRLFGSKFQSNVGTRYAKVRQIIIIVRMK